MDAVRMVSTDASMLLVSPITGFSMDQPAACLLAKTAATEKDLPANILERWNTECAFGTTMRNTTSPVFHAIATSRALPEVAFTFDAFVGLKAEWHTLGLFADLATCERMVEAAMSAGIGVRSCLPWKPRF